MKENMTGEDISNLLSAVGLTKKNQTLKFDLGLFEQALTHSSYSIDNDLGKFANNERLEFYGDSVLKLACSKFLYNRFPQEREGVLSEYRGVLVSDAYLVKYADEIEFKKYLRVSNRRDLKTPKAFDTICACAFEAFLAALFIQTDFDTVYNFLEPFFNENIDYVKENMQKINSKAALQEYTQSLNKNLPEYILVDESGKEHEKTFSVEVKYNGNIVGTGTGNSKKQAEQAAAYDACVNLGVCK